MKHIKFLLPVLFTFFILSCATVQDTEVKKWVGKTKTELVNRRGEPTEIKKDGKNGEIYYYEIEGKSYDGEDFRSVGFSFDYYINSKGRIYKVVQR